MTNTAATPEAKAVKRKPKPLLPPEEVVEIPQLPLTRTEKLVKLFKDKTPKIPIKSPFATPEITIDMVNEMQEVVRVDRAIKRMTVLAVLIAVFGVVLALGAPFFRPLYVYHSITPEGRTATLVPLDLPNLTNPAICAWAATSTTEVLSFGFGDVEAKTVLQKKRFTQLGWKAFVKAFLGSKVSDTFKKNQMVMTTVPTDTAVIVSQGINEDDVYQWKVDVPIITTYAANNNVIKPERGTIQMTIIRVPYEQSTSGIAIDIWRQVKH